MMTTMQPASGEQIKHRIIPGKLCLYLAAILAGVIPAALQAQGRDAQRWCEEARDWHWGPWEDGDVACEVRDVTLPADGELRADAEQNGSITVHGWDRDEILLRSRVWARARNADDAEDMLDRITIDTSGTIRPEGPANTRRRQYWAVSFEVFVPHDFDLNLEAYNGGLSVTGVKGDIRLNTLNGGILLDDIGGNVSGRTTNGGLSAVLTGRTWDGDRLDLQTTNGGIDIRIPDGYAAELETGTVNGRMRTDFPLLVEGDIGRRIRTTLGDGGPLIRARTTNGGVRLER